MRVYILAPIITSIEPLFTRTPNSLGIASLTPEIAMIYYAHCDHACAMGTVPSNIMRSVTILCLFLVLQLTFCKGDHKPTTFYITGLFPTDSRDQRVKNALGIYPRAAARYAVEEIIQLGLLEAHNVTLELESLPSGCEDAASAGQGLIQAAKLLKKEYGIPSDDDPVGEDNFWMFVDSGSKPEF